ncbi:O-methyltransferase [Natribacillus halophilus]|uniref:Predicted O-methyltransferase YrrM n=1 Tax=Natribacillus halophilus TaxID=549003 RepID=A0A1G8P152_9BACI|nr:O-methyltransferase [Natribacillus halophilus]SDI86045.1 Predicted O-methyltransferase YrrM [Natribacillus halophilus]
MKAYLDTLQNKPDLSELERMRAYAEKANIPILEEDSMQLLLQVLTLTAARHVLEIGSAIGYSALRMAASDKGRNVTTIERDRHRYEQAHLFLADSCYNRSITLLYGDAFNHVDTLAEKQPYDALFIDAAKGHNKAFIETFTPFVKTGGVIIVDNVFLRGWAAEPDNAPERLQNIAKKVHDFNQWLRDHPHLDTWFHPVGDGLAVSFKFY